MCDRVPGHGLSVREDVVPGLARTGEDRRREEEMLEEVVRVTVTVEQLGTDDSSVERLRSSTTVVLVNSDRKTERG